jgi:hypothetical protein
MNENNITEDKKALQLDLITFGKYKDKYLSELLRDRKYCEWLLQKEQDWFKESYEYLYNSVKNYDPKIYFFNECSEEDCDKQEHEKYKYFNLTNPEDLKIKLSEKELFCYKFYLKMIDDLKTKIKVNIAGGTKNPYDIKAPSKWLKQLEDEGKEISIKRDDFKEFLNCYELQNISFIIEDIKKMGGIEYKGAQSFNIGKKRSSEQELYWEEILKKKYNDQLGTQFKYEKCIFDFICIPKNTIFECKLGLKDFNEEQFNKYQVTLDKYNIIFLIGQDCVINLDLETIYTNDMAKYILYQCKIPLLKNPSKFDDMIFDFDIHEVEDLSNVI